MKERRIAMRFYNRHSTFGILRFDILFFEFGCGYAAPGQVSFPPPNPNESEKKNVHRRERRER